MCLGQTRAGEDWVPRFAVPNPADAALQQAKDAHVTLRRADN
jgi:hypothetical protein